MAWVIRRRDGWVVRWREGGRGSPKLTSDPFETKDAAEDFAQRQDDRTAAMRPLTRSQAAGSPIPLAEVAKRWAVARVADGAVAPTYACEVEAIVGDTAREMGWGSTLAVTPAEIDRWRKAHHGRVGRKDSYLRSVLRWAQRNAGQHLHPHALEVLRPPPRSRRIKPPLAAGKLVAEWQRLADAVGDSPGTLVHCLSLYAWRPVTAAKLTVADVDLGRGTISLRDLKGTGDELRHPLLPVTVKRLRKLCVGRAPGAPLFVDPRSGAAWVTDRSVHAPISDWWKKAIDGRRGHGVYQLKRVAISSMLQRGLPPADVALFSGHRTLAQVLTYSTTNEERAHAALAAIARARPGHHAGRVRSKARARRAK